MTRPATAKVRRDRPKPAVSGEPAQARKKALQQQSLQAQHVSLAWPHKVHWGVLVCLALALRLTFIDHIPGINGDEAWAAFKIRQFMLGQRDTWMLVTPTNRYIPLLGLLTWFCEQWGAPSFALMRIPGAMCGVGLVVAAGLAARRVFHWEVAAWAVATLVACLPMHIAYTRMTGADMFVGLSTLALAYCVLRGHWLMAVLVGFTVSLWVHPIISLLAPSVGLLIWYAVLPKWQASKPQKAVIFSLSIAVLGGCAWKLFTRYAGRTSQIGLAEALSVNNFLRFWVTLGDALSGGSSYFYFTGHVPAVWAFILSGVGLAILGLIVYTAIVLWKQEQLPVPDRTFAVGCVASALMFYAVSPLQSNGIERYCLFLTVPMVFSLGLLAQHGKFSARSIVVVTSLFCWLALASFYGLLLRPMLAGASSHETYSTANPEPKAAAWAWIAQDSQKSAGDRRMTIVADSWWLYWPLAYLSSESNRFHVYQAPGDGWGNEGGGYYLPHAGALQQVLGGGGYAVAFTDGRLTGLLQQLPGLHICGQQRFYDFAGKPLLDALRICPSL